MGILEIASFAVTASIGGVAFLRIFNYLRKNLCSIILNIMLGGSLFIILNMLGISLSFNGITGVLIALLGVPGVGLILMLKIVFGFF